MAALVSTDASSSPRFAAGVARICSAFAHASSRQVPYTWPIVLLFTPMAETSKVWTVGSKRRDASSSVGAWMLAMTALKASNAGLALVPSGNVSPTVVNAKTRSRLTWALVPSSRSPMPVTCRVAAGVEGDLPCARKGVESTGGVEVGSREVHAGEHGVEMTHVGVASRMGFAPLGVSERSGRVEVGQGEQRGVVADGSPHVEASGHLGDDHVEALGSPSTADIARGGVEASAQERRDRRPAGQLSRVTTRAGGAGGRPGCARSALRTRCTGQDDHHNEKRKVTPHPAPVATSARGGHGLPAVAITLVPRSMCSHLVPLMASTPAAPTGFQPVSPP